MKITEQELKEFDAYFDALVNNHLQKDAGNLWIAFSDKWNAFKKRILDESPAPADGWVREVCEYIQRVIGGERPDVTYLQDILKRNPAITPTP